MDYFEPIWLAFTFFFGACVGSFLNVVIYRIPNELSVVRPGSHCPECKSAIAWYDNLPCLSYLILKGRCRHCGVKYSAQYWCIELLGGFIGLGLWCYLAPTIDASQLLPATTAWLYWQGFIFALLALSIIDFKYLIIPDEISLFMLLLGVLGLFSINADTRADQLIGFVAGGGFLLLIAGLGYLVYRREAMGLGDVKLLALIGLFLGWQVLPLILFLAATQAILLVVVHQLASRFFNLGGTFVRTTAEVDAHFDEADRYAHLEEPSRLAIPFGPFLALGAIEAYFLGAEFFWSFLDAFIGSVLP